MPDLNLVINVAALTFIVDHAIEVDAKFDLESGIRSIPHSIPVLYPFYIRSISVPYSDLMQRVVTLRRCSQPEHARTSQRPHEQREAFSLDNAASCVPCQPHCWLAMVHVTQPHYERYVHAARGPASSSWCRQHCDTTYHGVEVPEGCPEIITCSPENQQR